MTDDTRETVGRWIGSFLRSLLRCWPILVVPAFLTAVATGTEQGRDAIAATATQLVEIGPGYHAYLAHSLSTVLATLAAVLLLGPAGGRLTSRNFAAYFVPALIGLLAGYAPLLALEWFGFGGVVNNAWLGL